MNIRLQIQTLLMSLFLAGIGCAPSLILGADIGAIVGEDAGIIVSRAMEEAASELDMDVLKITEKEVNQITKKLEALDSTLESATARISDAEGGLIGDSAKLSRQEKIGLIRNALKEAVENGSVDMKKFTSAFEKDSTEILTTKLSKILSADQVEGVLRAIENAEKKLGHLEPPVESIISDPAQSALRAAERTSGAVQGGAVDVAEDSTRSVTESGDVSFSDKAEAFFKKHLFGDHEAIAAFRKSEKLINQKIEKLSLQQTKVVSERTELEASLKTFRKLSKENPKLLTPKESSDLSNATKKIGDSEAEGEARLVKLKEQEKSVVQDIKESTEELENATKQITKHEGTIVRFIRNILGKIKEFGHMILQGILFGVPSMIYQSMMQAAAAAALRETILSPFELAKGLMIIIPQEIINVANPTSGPFIYIACDSNNNYDLETGDYFVMFQNGGTWASTYAQSQYATNQWVHLNSGLVFTGGGTCAPVNPGALTTYLLAPTNHSGAQSLPNSLLQQTVVSVAQYLQDALGQVGVNRSLSSFTEKGQDFDFISIKSSSSSVVANPKITNLFTSVASVGGEISYPAPLLNSALNCYRKGITGVTGILPLVGGTGTPAMSIKQLKGTGELNKLLGDPASTENVASSFAMIASPAIHAQLQNLYAAQSKLRTALSAVDVKKATVEAAAAGLGKAQDALNDVLAKDENGVQIGALSGLQQSTLTDVNGVNLYIYETTETPIAKTLQAHMPNSTLMPAKDYLICLDGNGIIQPIFLPAYQDVNGIGAITIDTTKLNPAIEYMCSLVSGITYTYSGSASTPGSVIMKPNADGQSIPDTSTAQTAMGTLFTQIACIMNSDSIADNSTAGTPYNLINQIISLASYATNLIYQGPLKKNGCLFTQVDWNSYPFGADVSPISIESTAKENAQVLADEKAQEIATILGDTNGQNVGNLQSVSSPFGPYVKNPAWKSSNGGVYVYKVTKNELVAGASSQSSDFKGALGTTQNGVEIYDYVVPLAASISNPGYYEIMPLGVSELLSTSVTGQAVQFMVSLVTGQCYDSNYCPLVSPPWTVTSVVKRDQNFSPLEASASFTGYTVPWMIQVLDKTTGKYIPTVIQVEAVPSVPMATAYMPTFCNPYNVDLISSLQPLSNGASVGSESESTSYKAALTAYTSAQTEAAATQKALNKAIIAVTADVRQAVKGNKKAKEIEGYWLDFQATINKYSHTIVTTCMQTAGKSGSSFSLADALQKVLAVSEITKHSKGVEKKWTSTAKYPIKEWIADFKKLFKDQPSGAADIQTWIAARIAFDAASYNFTIATSKAQQAAAKAFANSVISADGLFPLPATQQLVIPAMYWMHYTKFCWSSFAGPTGVGTPISYTPYNAEPATALMNWVDLTTTGASQAFTDSNNLVSFGSSLPECFVREVIKAYNNWQAYQNGTSVVAQVMQAGPFNFSTLAVDNVYLTLPAVLAQGTNVSELNTGSFFYNLSPVFTQSELFVLGEYSGLSALVQTIESASGTQSLLKGSAFLQACNNNSRLGKSYFAIETENLVAIDIATGNVWAPASQTAAIACMQAGGTQLAETFCTIQKIGQVDPQAALILALQNQFSDFSSATGSSSNQADVLVALMKQLRAKNPTLASMVSNCQALANEQAQASMYATFAGRTLQLSGMQNEGDSYVYAVVTNETTPFLEAKDYWIVVNQSSNGAYSYAGSTVPAAGKLTAGPNVLMMSLISGKVFGVGSETSSGNSTQSYSGGVIVTSPKDALDLQIGSLTISAALSQRITLLNTAANASYVKKQLSNSLINGINTLPLPVALATATSVGGTGSVTQNLYQVGSKYYLVMPGSGANSTTYYYDFNSQQPSYDTATGEYIGALSPKSAGYVPQGVYYTAVAPGATLTAQETAFLDMNTGSANLQALPTSVVTGGTYQAMLTKYGLAVDKDGNESLTLPINNPSLVMTEKDKALKPGKSGDNMLCLMPTEKGAVTSFTSTQQPGYQNYYYLNMGSQLYLARCTYTEKVNVAATDSESGQTTTITKDYYVDLMSGQRYDIQGNPYLSDVAVAYCITSTQSAPTGTVSNGNLDFSNPLFVWGQLDILGEALNTIVMFQDINPYDTVSYGFNIYSVAQGASNNIFFNLLGHDLKTITQYSYSSIGSVQTAVLGSDGVYSAAQPVSPASTNLTQSVLDAIQNGSYLIQKGYSLYLGGSSSGMSIDVTETCIAPKQYTVICYGYNASGGSLDTTYYFQTPQQSIPVTAITAATLQSYNNPPLDAGLQNQLIAATPFSATLFGSRAFGSSMPISAPSTAGLTVPQTICGLLGSTPVKGNSNNSSLQTKSLLGVTFNGAVPAPSTNSSGSGAGGTTGNTSGGILSAPTPPSTAGQFFAWFGNYNNANVNGSGNTIQNNASTTGTTSYSPYISVAPSMALNFTNLNPYPALWGGTFGVLNPMQGSGLVSPYVCITSIPTSDSNSNTNSPNNYLSTYSEPTGATEYMYEYNYSMVPNNILAGLKQNVFLISTATGSSNLISALSTNFGSVSAVVSSSASATLASLLVSTISQAESNIKYATPLIPLVGAPAGRYLYQLECSGVDSASPVCALVATLEANNTATPLAAAGSAIGTSVTTSSPYYVDLFNSLLFGTSTGTVGTAQETILSPVGIPLPSQSLTAIMARLGNPTLVSKQVMVNGKSQMKLTPATVQVNSVLPTVITPLQASQKVAVLASATSLSGPLSFQNVFLEHRQKVHEQVAGVVAKVRSLFSSGDAVAA